jgi:glycosyltransferase involved in cell wall biosynthesis
MGQTKILFITWDNPRVNYLEGLFAPIFEILHQKHGYDIHIIQFSWADSKRITFLNALCAAKNIVYQHYRILTMPAVVGKFLSTRLGTLFVDRYIRQHGIDIVIPRSTMPASMINSLRKKHLNLKIIFDADGLPIEERVDFAGLKKGSLRHRQLKQIESKMITHAHAVLTRSERATAYLAEQYGANRAKFFVVKNGRDSNFFSRDLTMRAQLRRELNIPPDALVMAYVGSMGPQYGLEQMVYIHNRLIQEDSSVYLLLLTNNPAFFQAQYPALKNVVVRHAPFAEIPAYLSTADFGLAIRKSTFSMRGVAPIKLGEYLLMGLPVIASADIGDTEAMLANKPFVFLLPDFSEENLSRSTDWVRLKRDEINNLRGEARAFAEQNFTLLGSASDYQKAIASVL